VRNRKRRLDPVGSTNSSEAGIGMYRCAGGCGKSVLSQGDFCDNCQDLFVEPDEEEEKGDITEAEWIAIYLDSLGI
jgi:hypothetical protein